MNAIIDPETAKAAGRIADASGKAIDASCGIGSFIAKVLGTAPQDAVGFLIGDWLRHTRIRNWHRLEQRTAEILRERSVSDTEKVSPSVAIPLIEAAQDESREELQELWAKLLASTMDPARSRLVRKSFIELAKQLDPLDAAVLKKMVELWERHGYGHEIKYFDALSAPLNVSSLEIVVSVEHLQALGLVFRHGIPTVNNQGLLFLQAVGDLGVGTQHPLT